MNAVTYRGLPMPSDFLTDEILAWKIGIDQAMEKVTVEPSDQPTPCVIGFYGDYLGSELIDVYREFSDGVVEFWSYYSNKWSVFNKDETIEDVRSRKPYDHSVLQVGYDVVEQFKKNHDPNNLYV